MVLGKTSPTYITHYSTLLVLLLRFLASTDWFLWTLWGKPANERLRAPCNTSFQLSWCPPGLSVEVHVEDRARNRTELRTGWNKNSMKRLRGLTGMWLDWHWCGVGDFLTRTCLQAWHCSQTDNNVAFLHQQHRPALILSECLFSSGKTRDPCQSAHGNAISTYLQARHNNPFKETINERKKRVKALPFLQLTSDVV